MTPSQIRRHIDALKRKFARELAIIKLRRIAEDVSHHWTPAEPPERSGVISRTPMPASACPPSPASAAI